MEEVEGQEGSISFQVLFKQGWCHGGGGGAPPGPFMQPPPPGVLTDSWGVGRIRTAGSRPPVAGVWRNRCPFWVTIWLEDLHGNGVECECCEKTCS